MFVNTMLNVSTTSLTLPATTAGTAGATTSFTVSGSGLGSDDSMFLERSHGEFEISTSSSSGFGNFFYLFADASGTLPTTTVYARISRLGHGQRTTALFTSTSRASPASTSRFRSAAQ